MVPVMSLWLPIVLSAVVVFVASSIVHMVLPYHRSDMQKLPHEPELLEAFRRYGVPPGDYGAPHATSPAALKDPAFIDKMRTGPVVYMTLSPGAPPSMGPSLAMWFGYLIVVSVFAAYIAGHALGPAAPRLEVVRFAGCTAFAANSLALLQQSIWYRRSWGTTLKSMFDGLGYALLTGATFAWLWPR